MIHYLFKISSRLWY